MMINKNSILKLLAVVFLSVSLLSCATRSSVTRGEWSFELNGGCIPGTTAVSEPVISNGVVFIGSRDGAVYAINANTGKQVWRFQTGRDLSTTPEIVHASKSSSATDMLNTYAESVKGRSKGKRYISATPVVYNDTVYIGSWDNRFYALDAVTGKEKWSFDARVPIFKKAIIADQKIIFVTGGRHQFGDKVDGLAYALNPASGKVLWVFDTLPADTNSRWRSHLPEVRNNLAYVVNWDSKKYEEGVTDTSYIHAIDIKTGKARWSVNVNGAWPSPPTINDSYIFLITDTRGSADTSVLHAIDISNGKETWSFEVVGGNDYWRSMSSHNMYTSPLTHENLAFLATDRDVIAININTGKEQWRVGDKFADKEWISDIDLGPLLYITTKTTLYALNPKSGRTLWSKRLTYLTNVRVWIHRVMDGIVYAAPHPYKLIAIDGLSGKDLGTVVSPGLLNSLLGSDNAICSGPVRYGNQIFLSTEMYWGMGKPISKGRLFSVAAPKLNP